MSNKLTSTLNLSLPLRNHLGQTEEEFLANYKVGDYERPSNTVDIVLFRPEIKDNENVRLSPEVDLKILLIRRKDHPCLGQLALPGGFCNKNESMNESARRELEEETNVVDCYMEEVSTYSTPKRDPRTWVVSHSFLAIVPPDAKNVKAGDDASDALWFSIKRTNINPKQIKIELYNEETNEKIVAIQNLTIEKNGRIEVLKYSKPEYESELKCAFDHIEIIADALEKLEKRAYDVAFLEAALPKEFTLSTMQTVAEILLGKSLVKQNFRTKVAPYLVASGKNEDTRGYRPAQLYKFKNKIYLC